MKHLLLLPIALLSLTAGAQSIYPGGIHDCVARWDFSSNGTPTSLPDVSNNGNNGTIVHLVSTAGYRGQANTAMTFDGATSMVTVPHNAILVPQQMTMVALVKFTGFYTGTCQSNEIVGKGNTYFVNGSYHLAVADADGDCNNYTPNDEHMGAAFANATSAFPTIPPTALISPNVWYFLAASYDGNTYNEYLKQMDPNNYVSSIAPVVHLTGANALIGVNTDDLNIGFHADPNYPYWFTGAMDEVAIFNRPLADSEVQSVYNYMWGYNVGVSNVANPGSITIYPNPATDHVTIESNEPLSAKLYSMDGRLLVNEHHAKQLNVSGLPAGIYIIALYDDSGTLIRTDKIVK